MPLIGVKYQQKAPHLLDRGELGKNVNRWLNHKICIAGYIVTAGEATDKQFAIYIWSVLPQLYKGQTTKMNRAFDEHFDRDWTDLIERAHALARLVEINRSRGKGKRIRLFLEN